MKQVISCWILEEKWGIKKRENYPPYTFSFQKKKFNNNNLLHFWPNRPCPKRGLGIINFKYKNSVIHPTYFSVQFPIRKNQLIPYIIANNKKDAMEAAMNDESILYSDLTGPINSFSFSFSFYVQLQNCENTTKDPAPLVPLMVLLWSDFE